MRGNPLKRYRWFQHREEGTPEPDRDSNRERKREREREGER